MKPHMITNIIHSVRSTLPKGIIMKNGKVIFSRSYVKEYPVMMEIYTGIF